MEKELVSYIANYLEQEIMEHDGVFDCCCIQGWIEKAIEAFESITDTNDPVDLIASGYEWNCTACGQLCHEIEITENVKCQFCGVLFSVSVVEHAHG